MRAFNLLIIGFLWSMSATAMSTWQLQGDCGVGAGAVCNYKGTSGSEGYYCQISNGKVTVSNENGVVGTDDADTSVSASENCRQIYVSNGWS